MLGLGSLVTRKKMKEMLAHSKTLIDKPYNIVFHISQLLDSNLLKYYHITRRVNSLLAPKEPCRQAFSSSLKKRLFTILQPRRALLKRLVYNN